MTKKEMQQKIIDLQNQIVELQAEIIRLQAQVLPFVPILQPVIPQDPYDLYPKDPYDLYPCISPYPEIGTEIGDDSTGTYFPQIERIYIGCR